jgi:hypothetical protein
VSGWERPSEAAAEAAVWGLLETAAKKRKDEARAWLHDRMGPDLAAVKAVANGETIGQATWVQPDRTWVVVDDAAFMEYVGRKWPNELVTTVNTAFQGQLFSGLKRVGADAVDKDGELVPGLDFRATKAPYVAVSKDDSARETVEVLLSSGRIGLNGITQHEIEAGAADD